jgi:hypothetical protein
MGWEFMVATSEGVDTAVGAAPQLIEMRKSRNV